MNHFMAVYKVVSSLVTKKGVNLLQVNPYHFPLVEVSGIEPLTS